MAKKQKKPSNKKLFKNHSSMLCKNCNTTIMSYHRHDFNHCECGNIFIDGGTDYTRFGCTPGSAYESFLRDWEVDMDTGEKTLLDFLGE